MAVCRGVAGHARRDATVARSTIKKASLRAVTA